VELCIADKYTSMIQYLERLYGGALILSSLVVITRKWALQFSASVPDLDVLFNGNVAPVGNLDHSLHAGDGQERGVVLAVHSKLSLQGNFQLFFYYRMFNLCAIANI